MDRRAWMQPDEQRLFTYDFTDLLQGRTITSMVGTPSSVARVGATTLTIDGTPLVTPTAVQVEWKSGTVGNTYLTTVKVMDSQGQEHELEGEIIIADVGFTLPDGSVTSDYLTGEDYVDRFGYEETVRLTDEDRTGVINLAKLQAAISDAVEIVNAYLGVRYTLPMVPVPTLVKGLVAALAREKLHTLRPTAQVTLEGDRARSQLKDISAGRMALPAPDGSLPDLPTGGLASHGGCKDGEVFNACKLARY
jgi:phage gp36-like protein